MRLLLFAAAIAACHHAPATPKEEPAECELFLDRRGLGDPIDEIDICSFRGETFLCTVDRCYRIGLGR